MSDVVIKVENLTKEYRLGVINHGTLAKDLQAWWAKKRGKDDPNSTLPHLHNYTGQKHGSAPTHFHTSTDKIYALKDINFSVSQGEVLGIIGANGAGKSTLLKILSRVTSPTSGCVKIKGRIGSLLEVGTGFHPELTGRENIYLNGAILGMKKWEIDKKLDEIIDFSGVEKFIDTPVKRYSSGMYVRLAFAVAAHLDPEILVVDEVLAVGDAEFQKKCLGKMGDISKKEGRTVLFVSHNMGAVRQLCGNCISLNEGKIIEIGNTEKVVANYLSKINKYSDTSERVFKIDEKKDFQVVSVRLRNNKNEIVSEFECDEEIKIEFECISRNPIPFLYGFLQVSNSESIPVIVSDSKEFSENPFNNMLEGNHKVIVNIPRRILGVGKYSIYINFASQFNANGWNVESPGNVCAFSVIDSITERGNNRRACTGVLLKWDILK